MREINIGGTMYSTVEMPAMTQFHVMRRLLPLLSSLTAEAAKAEPVPAAALDPAATGASDGVPEGFSETVLKAGETMMSNIATQLASLPDETCDYVIRECLKCVRRQDGGKLVPVWNVPANRPQYADMSVATLIRLTSEVVMEYVAPFLAGLPAIAGGNPGSPGTPQT